MAAHSPLFRATKFSSFIFHANPLWLTPELTNPMCVFTCNDFTIDENLQRQILTMHCVLYI